MEPVTLIVTALAAGASAALKDTAGAAVKDAYTALKELVKRRVAMRQVVEMHEQEPETWQKPLESELERAQVAADDELVRAAQETLQAVDPEGSRAGKYRVSVTGSKGVVIGDNANVNMTFND